MAEARDDSEPILEWIERLRRERDARAVATQASAGSNWDTENAQLEAEIAAALVGRTIDGVTVRPYSPGSGDWNMTLTTHLAYYRDDVPDKATITLGFNDLAMFVRSIVATPDPT